jgi:osomolarity two-component system response regulator SKN7
MNDVLAKPFTRDGMVRILRKHLTRMLKDPQSAAGLVGGVDDMSGPVAGAPPHQQPNQGPGGPGGGGGYGPATMAGMPAMAGQVKFEHTPIQSPSTASSWHSPGQMHQASPGTALDGSAAGAVPGGYLAAAGAGGMVLTPGGSQRPLPLPGQQQQQHMGQHPGQHPGQQQQQQQQAHPGQYAGYMTAQQVAGAHMAGLQVGPGGPGAGVGDDRPEKRQRLYGPVPGQGPGGYVQ